MAFAHVGHATIAPAGTRRSSMPTSAPQARIDWPVDKRQASHPFPQAAFKLASFLRQSRLAHAFENRLKLGQKRRVVAPRGQVGPKAGDGEGRVEREAGIDCRMRLVKPTKLQSRRRSSQNIDADNFGWPRSPVETTRPLAPKGREDSSRCPLESSRHRPSYRAD